MNKFKFFVSHYNPNKLDVFKKLGRGTLKYKQYFS